MNDDASVRWHMDGLDDDVIRLAAHNSGESPLSNFEHQELLRRLHNGNFVVAKNFGDDRVKLDGSAIDGHWRLADWVRDHWNWHDAGIAVFLVIMCVLFGLFIT